jgi:DNA-binding protein Fis
MATIAAAGGAVQIRVDLNDCLKILEALQTALERQAASRGILSIQLQTGDQTVHVTATEFREEPGPPVGSLSWQHVTAAVRRLVDETIADRPGRVHHDLLEMFERIVLERALEVTGGRQLPAARLLGLNRNTVRGRCCDLQIHVPRTAPATSAVRPVSSLLEPERLLVPARRDRTSRLRRGSRKSIVQDVGMSSSEFRSTDTFSRPLDEKGARTLT